MKKRGRDNKVTFSELENISFLDYMIIKSYIHGGNNG